ncbi:MAG: ABC transporter substrate-binding protein [Alphaproteobacteria bacterium]|nr:ABC transporter substrate-binding protein [Alphaproteobacteria bacterium]
MRLARVALLAFLAFGPLLPSGAGRAAEGPASHGLSAFGDLKYPADFRHFDYVNPRAPKGGELRLWSLESFDSLNPFVLRGVPADGMAYNGIAAEGAFVYESLMEQAMDEPDSYYGLIARSAELAPDRSAVAFEMRPEARFHDGTPITAEDVVFTLNALVAHGHPRYRLLYAPVALVEAAGPHRVVFRFKPGAPRDLHLLVGAMPVLPAAHFRNRPFGQATLEPIPGSGPYRVERVDAGRSITYRRVEDYWARDLPVNRGRHNFDRIRFDYYRDRDVAFEAFFAGRYDFRQEPGPKNWATGYERPPLQKGLIQRETLRDHTPSGVQGFFLNTRREHLADRRVREALALAYDFEWSNRTLFYSLFKRMRSMFENSEMAARGVPQGAELALLEPHRAKLPPELFTEEFHPPRTDGSGSARENLRKAQALLAEAGYQVRDGRLLHERTGQPLQVEFLLFEGVFQRVVAPYLRNLERLGVEASVRLIDNASFQNRMERFDFDIIVRRFVQPITPGSEQRNFWGSEGAGTPGSLNFAGVRDPVADAMIERIEKAPDRAALVDAARALDRVLTWNWYVIPHFYSGNYRIAFWNRFGRPEIKPKYALGVVDTWWHDPKKAAMIAKGLAPPALEPLKD